MDPNPATPNIFEMSDFEARAMPQEMYESLMDKAKAVYSSRPPSANEFGVTYTEDPAPIDYDRMAQAAKMKARGSRVLIQPEDMVADFDQILDLCQVCQLPPDKCDCSAQEDALFDTLLANASVPNLAALYKRAQEQGLVKPMYHYQSTT